MSNSQQELIEEAGFEYEVHDAIADDGYITQVTHLINPLADRKRLRKPPVLMEHGGTIDPTAYLIASTSQHHPEVYPRGPRDGPMTSWNRSLAFTLSNLGFDLWLAETRGSSDKNRRRVKSRVVKTINRGANAEKNMTEGEQLDEIMRVNDFWAFSQDDIINHELKSHMDLVLKLTGSDKLSLMTFSLSTPTSLAFFSIRNDYAEKIQGYISMAPIISGEGVSNLVKLVLHTICPLLPDKIGTVLLSDLMLTQPIRDLAVLISVPKIVRYSLVKSYTTLLMGPSAKYQTLLDLNVLGHMLRQLSFKEAKQLCQQTKANRLQKYDYGPIKNLLIYNSTEPPAYNLRNIHIHDWIIVSAPNDALSTPQVIDHLLSLVHPKPIANIVAPGYNHLDLIAAFENDRYVNLPIANYLIKMSESYEETVSEARFASSGRLGEELQAVASESVNVRTSAARDISSTFANLTNIDPVKVVESFQKNLTSFLGDFGGFFNGKQDDKPKSPYY